MSSGKKKLAVREPNRLWIIYEGIHSPVPCEHRGPVNPLGHVHLKTSDLTLVHVPPFLQGLLSHGLFLAVGEKQKNNEL